MPNQETIQSLLCHDKETVMLKLLGDCLLKPPLKIDASYQETVEASFGTVPISQPLPSSARKLFFIHCCVAAECVIHWTHTH